MRFGTASKVALVLVGLGVASSAQAVPLDGTILHVTSGSLSADFSASNCSYTGGTCSGFQMVQDGSNLGILIETNPTGGTLSNTNNDATLTNDLSFTLDIANVSPYFVGILATLTGSTDPGTSNTATTSFAGGSVQAVTGASGVVWFSAVNALSTSVDIGADGFTPNAYITTVTNDLLVPEPASFGLLAVGLGAMALAKRPRT